MEQLSLIGEAGTSNFEVPKILDPLRLTGSVEKVVYFNEISGQCILDLKVEDAKSHVLVSGALPFIYPGQDVEAWLSTKDSESGALLVAERLQSYLPTSPRSLKKFLKSGAFSRLGPHLAGLLAKNYPDNFFSVVEDNPALLLKTAGIGQKRQLQILEDWRDYKACVRLKQFLFENSLPLNWSQTLWAFHKMDALSYLQEHPYECVSEHRFSFELMDSFALARGFSLQSPARIKCGLYDILHNFYKLGHCAVAENHLLNEAPAKLNIPPSLIENALEIECLNEELVIDQIGETSCVFLKSIWQLEKKVAEQLLAFEKRAPPWGWFHIQKVLGWAQTVLNIQLAPLQQQAIEAALNSSLTVITGGPGTGKTTLIRSLVTILQTQFSKFALCSPTGRAAQRLAEATGVKAQTIHRLLKYNSDGSFSFHQGNPLDLDLVLIDEASMVDLALMSHLLEALPSHCALILVGDADQIPPVGAGNILQSVIDSGRFQVVRLTDIYRQQERSLIKLNAHRINSGQMPLTESSGQNDFHFIPVHSVEETKSVLLDLVTRVLPKQCGITDPRQFQILVPMNRGPLGTQQLNEELQQMIKVELGDSEADQGLQNLGGFGQSFQPGDKVMVLKNDYQKEIFNGDIGFIDRIDREKQCLYVQFEERNIYFSFEHLDRLTLAYAISIHKSQGSEYKAVIVVISPEHLPLAQRHLIYTAVTRGKEHVFLVANPETLHSAIVSNEDNQRWQKLTERLRKSSLSN
jgi:exodeoxyribonuclease V alpha subunit